MVDANKINSWPGKLLAFIQHLLTEGTLALILSNVVEVWGLLAQIRERLGFHGMYEILSYDSTLEIQDDNGEEASLVRHEIIRFLQDNVVAIHDHAWGDGDLFAEYYCQPGIPVDFYEDGSKHNVLISLRETKNRGDILDLWVHRVIRGGFRQADEWLETEIDHLTKHLKLSILFPKNRPCGRAGGAYP